MKTNTQRKPKSLKFIRLYNSLNEQERNEFRYFVQMSNIEGRNYESILDLTTGTDFHLKKNGSVSDRTLWNRISELTILLEKYLSMKEFFDDKENVKLLLNRQFRKRNLNDLYLSGLKKYDKELSNMILKPHTFHLKHELYNEASLFAAKENNMDEYIRYRELFEINYISDFIINLIIHSFDTLVNDVKGVKINSGLTRLIIDSAAISSIIKLITEKDKNLGNQLQTLHDLTLTFNKNEIDSLFKAKEIFYRDIGKNSAEFNQLMFKFMLNYCIHKREIDTGKHFEVLEDTILELFEKKIKYNFYSDLLDPNPSMNQFRDFILLAGRRKISLLNLYMEIVFPHVNPADRSEVEFFTEVIRNFYSGDFENSLACLNKIKKKHYLHYFDNFKFSSMIYLETSKFVELSQCLINFRTYVNRHKEFSEFAKTKIFNFINCMNLLSGYKEKREVKYSDLEFKIKEKTPLLERSWLLKQLSILK